MAAQDVSLLSDVIFTVQGVGITNSVLAGGVVSILLILFVALCRPTFSLVPSKIQIAFEMVLMNFYDALKAAYGSEKRAKRYLPFVLTLFLFLLLANQFSLIPVINDLVSSGANPVDLFKTPTSDWSLPLSLALITVIGAQIIALTIHPFRHIGNYIRVKQFFTIKSGMDVMFAFIEFCLGLLEIVSEFAKVISLSARLFGNVFAGEVMIVIIAGLFAGITTYVVPMPFIILSMFSGLVQAYVFAFLSLQFMAITVQSARGEA